MSSLYSFTFEAGDQIPDEFVEIGSIRDHVGIQEDMDCVTVVQSDFIDT
jgi:hypothetical protein